MNWRLEKCEDEAAAEAELAAAGESPAADGARPTWGVGMLWVPTELQTHEPLFAVDTNGEEPQDASAEELGEYWGVHGAEWAWAHDGLKQNGWIHLRSGGAVASRWGLGKWTLLEATQPPLLLITFNDVEHALRLEDDGKGPPGFDLVLKRRLAGEQSVAEDPSSPAYGRLVDPRTPACCATRGWPSPGIAPRRAGAGP